MANANGLSCMVCAFHFPGFPGSCDAHGLHNFMDYHYFLCWCTQRVDKDRVSASREADVWQQKCLSLGREVKRQDVRLAPCWSFALTCPSLFVPLLATILLCSQSDLLTLQCIIVLWWFPSGGTATARGNHQWFEEAHCSPGMWSGSTPCWQGGEWVYCCCS